MTMTMGLLNAYVGLLEKRVPCLSGNLEMSLIVVGFLTALAFLTRFYKINNPDQVVYV